MKNKSPEVKIGTSPQRISLADKSKLESPGPNKYFNQEETRFIKIRNTSGPKWSIGTSQR